MPDTLPAQIGSILTALVCLFALWKGDLPERAGAILFVAAWLGSLALSNDTAGPGVRYGAFAMDVLASFGFAAIAWRSRRTWAIWAAGFAAMTMMSHVAYALDRRIGMYAYVTVEVVASYLVLIALAIGTWAAWRERERPEPPR
jgi:hypothetical protein